MMFRFSKDYMAGWNNAHMGIDLRGRFRSKDAEKGWRDYMNAPQVERIPFADDIPGVPGLQTMHDMLVKCMLKFKDYASQHRAKGSHQKAEANEKMAKEIEEVLNNE